MDRETKLDIIEIGRGYFGAILLTILMHTGVVSAMYAGDCDSLDVSELDTLQDITYIVAGNSSDMTGMDLVINGSSIEICLDMNYKPDNFTLIFFNNITNEIIKEVHTYTKSSGGSTRYIDRNITVEYPVFHDRNITKTEEVPVKGDDIVVYEYRDKFNFWFILLGTVVGIIFTYSIFYYFMRIYVPREERNEEV